MNTISLLIIYASIAMAVAAHVFYFGVLNQPRVSVFTLSHHGTLGMTALAVGAVWPLFVPALLALAVAKAVHAIRSRSGSWSLPRAQQARAGS